MLPIVTCAAALLLLQSSVFAQFTWWVDDATCRDTQARTSAFDKAIRGAVDLANRGYSRLQSQTDTDMKDLVQSIFKTSFQNDANARNLINGVLGTPPPVGAGVASWTQTMNRLTSNVRIYCDNDAQNVQGGSRWTLVPDIAPALQWPGYVPNAQRPRAFQPGQPAPGAANAPSYQEWEDTANAVSTLSRGCQTPNTVVQGETYTPGLFQQTPAGQPQIRSVVTLCNLQLNSALHSFEDIPLKRDINTLVKPPAIPNGIDAFTSMTAFTLLHEFTHCRPHTREDVLMPNGLKAYAWTDILALNNADSLQNVNNYVYLSVLGKLADRHWRLSKVYNDWRNRGALVYDLHGITAKVKRRAAKWRG